MTNLTAAQIEKKIAEFEEKYRNEIKEHGGITKNAVFYESTANLYRKDLEKKKKAPARAKELNAKINELEADLKEELDTHEGLTKRALFIATTINGYLKELGKPAKYNV